LKWDVIAAISKMPSTVVVLTTWFFYFLSTERNEKNTIKYSSKEIVRGSHQRKESSSAGCTR
jgi:hypothetical protein